jgi:ParB-like chromosome segregation protein Spo0J
LPVTWLETRDVPLTELTRFPGNARRGNTEEIRASLRRNGQYRALVVRDTGDGLVILAGNHTRDAIEAEHHTVARCEILTCTDAEARRINLADNRLAEIGTYDDDALVELLSYLDEDYEGTGWDENEVSRLLGAAVGERGDPSPPDEFPGYGDDIDTQYQCPKCSYEWSGKPK